MPSPKIRPLAICVFSHQGRILVNIATDSVSRQRFCRPLGGGIEFGETSEQTISREIKEEINAEVSHLRFIGTLENIFLYLGVRHHEIVQVYDGHFVDASLYQQAEVYGQESDGNPFKAVWLSLNDFSEDLPLYPNGLLAILQSQCIK